MNNQETNANNIITVDSYIVGSNFVFMSEQLPSLFIKEQHYETAMTRILYGGEVDIIAAEKYGISELPKFKIKIKEHLESHNLH